jgi:hypothetical protein
VYLLNWNSAGDYQWVKTWSAMGKGYFPGIAQGWGGSPVTVDNLDNILVLSDLDGYVDLDPGPGVVEYTGSGMSLTKFDPDGNFTWADIWQSPGLIQLISYAVTTDQTGNIFVAGGYDTEVDFDPGAGVDNHPAIGARASYALKLNSTGGFLWANSWGPTSMSDFSEAWGACADQNGNAYVCGYFEGTVDFEPGPGVDNHSASEWTGYLIKFLPGGTW